MTAREGSWTLTTLVASGANEPAYPTIFHFNAGGAKGDESFEGENLLVEDMEAYRGFYEDLAMELKKKYDMDSDHQRYHNGAVANIFARKYLDGKGSRNNMILRTAWSACLWDMRRIDIAKTIADALNRHFEGDVVKVYTPELKEKKCGY